ncbi:hypothetical protein Misp05_43820 [Micromonospora sp. NBRC 107095]|nr:hypothetical protein Misp05_43820 [Micromonospora sp. NBRC 107095]
MSLVAADCCRTLGGDRGIAAFQRDDAEMMEPAQLGDVQRRVVHQVLITGRPTRPNHRGVRSTLKTPGGHMAVRVSDVPEAKRYEARVDGESTVAGVAQYIRTTELVAFVHTEVSPEYEGRGVGAALARTALDEARAAHLLVLATCPFIAGWIARHPEYQDLVYQAHSRVSD